MVRSSSRTTRQKVYRSDGIYTRSSVCAEDEEEREILQIAKILLQLTRPKRKRHQTTPKQLEVLEAVFEVDRTPDLSTRTRLADDLDMTPRRIQIWFQNKRAKLKKMSKQRSRKSSASARAAKQSPPSSPPLAKSSPQGKSQLPSLSALQLPDARLFMQSAPHMQDSHDVIRQPFVPFPSASCYMGTA